MLTNDQVNLILELINKQVYTFAGSTLGPQVLSDQEKELLKKYHINVQNIYSPKHDLVNLNFSLGLLSNILGQEKTKGLTFEQLFKYVQSGQHIPLNARERATVESIKRQSLADIRSAQGRIFTDVNNVVNNGLLTARSNQEEFLREQILDRTASRQSRKEIASQIARLTGDWNRDFRKSVAYISHTALNEGKAAIIHRRAGNNKTARVYFHVQSGACQSCIQAYLTNGTGSEPKIFMLSELEANGNNIGKKQKEWLPVVGAMHIYCRCTMAEYIEGQVWNGERFVWPKGAIEKKRDRPKVRIEFNGQEYWV